MVRARSFGSIRKLPSDRYQARYWHLGTRRRRIQQTADAAANTQAPNNF